MTTAYMGRREKKMRQPPCPKCRSTASSTEKDILGAIRTCSICGHCTYMDREGNIMEEQRLGDKRPDLPGRGPIRRRNPKRTRATPPRATPPTEHDEQWKLNETETASPAGETGEQWKLNETETASPAGETGEQWKLNETETASPAGETEEQWKLNENETTAIAEKAEEPAPTGAGETTTDTGETWSAAPAGETWSAAPAGETWSAAPAGETWSAAPAGETGKDREELETGAPAEEPGAVPADEREEPEDAPQEKESPGCPHCGNPYDQRKAQRFRRMPLIQCAKCWKWEVNPEQESDLGSRDPAIGATIQMALEATPARRLQAEAERLTDAIHAIPSNVPWWLQRYTIPGSARMRELKALQSGSSWEIDMIPVKCEGRTHRIWSITDPSTQYVLATGRTEQNSIQKETFELAEQTAGNSPELIILGINTPENMPGMEEYTRDRKIEIVRDTQEGENPDGSMTRLRNAVGMRAESSRGRLSKDSMDQALHAAVLSINLFEECPNGNTPAENAGIASPYSNWTDLIGQEGRNSPPLVTTRKKSTAGNQTRNSGQATPEAAEQNDGEERKMDKDQTDQGRPDTAELPAGEPDQDGDARMNRTLAGVLEELTAKQQRLYREFMDVREARQAVRRTIEILEGTKKL